MEKKPVQRSNWHSFDELMKTEASTVKSRLSETRLSGPRLSGFLDYPDF